MATYTDIDTLRRDMWDVSDEEITPQILNRAATMAYNKINGYLNGIYSVPFGTAPALVQDISDLLTKGYSMLFVRYGQKKPEDIPELQTAHDELLAIAKGESYLPDATRQDGRGPAYTMGTHGHIFDLDHSIFHVPDSDYLDDVADMREDG